MKIRLALSGLLGVALCATATANNFSVSGPGGAIPDCPFNGGPWNAVPTWPVLTTNVSVTYPVTSITAVKLQGLTHTFRGDVHVFIADPAGVRYNVVVRAGFTGAGAGDGGNYNLGNYDFVESGGGTVAQGATNINGGTYNQYLNSGGGMWTSGTYVINNTPLSAITGPAGTWSLTIVDWYAADLGSITGWTLEGTDNPPGPVVFCEPGVGGVIPCPCGNPPSGAGRGCNNFGQFTGGASLVGSGTASLSADTLLLSATGENNTSLTVFWGGEVDASPGFPNGAGVRCVSTALKRLYKGSAVVGAIARPGMGDLTVSAAQGGITAGQTRYYYNTYRDPNAAGPCGDSSSTINTTNAVAVTWSP